MSSKSPGRFSDSKEDTRNPAHIPKGSELQSEAAQGKNKGLSARSASRSYAQRRPWVIHSFIHSHPSDIKKKLSLTQSTAGKGWNSSFLSFVTERRGKHFKSRKLILEKCSEKNCLDFLTMNRALGNSPLLSFT